MTNVHVLLNVFNVLLTLVWHSGTKLVEHRISDVFRHCQMPVRVSLHRGLVR